MEQLTLKYTYADGRKATEFESIQHGGQPIDARYIEKPDGSSGWYDRSGVMVTPDATQVRQKPSDDLAEHQNGDEGGQAAKASGGNRTGKGGKKPEAKAEG